MNRITQIEPGDTLQIVCEDNSLSRECDRLRAELVALNERYATLQAAAIDFWLAAYVVSPAGEAASKALVDLFDARAVVHTEDLEPLPAASDVDGEAKTGE